MDEDKFFEHRNLKFAELYEVIKTMNAKLEGLNMLYEDILRHVKVKHAVKTSLADFSKDKVSHERSKPMPEMLGKYTISKKGCNRCWSWWA